MNGREKLSNWESLWSDLLQEKIKQNTIYENSSKGKDEENCAFAGVVTLGNRSRLWENQCPRYLKIE